MESPELTGAGACTAKPCIDDLGPIPNLSDKLDIEKIVVASASWAEVARRLVETKLYFRVNGNAIARVMLLVWLEKETANAAAPTEGSQASERPQALFAEARPHPSRLRPKRS